MPRKSNKAQEALTDNREGLMSQQLVSKKKDQEQEVVSRPTALDFKKTEKLKELILQDVKRNNGQTYIQYTKSLVKQYLANPGNFRMQLVGVSKFLWRVSTLYRKIILYYATLPLYNYNITQKMKFTEKPDVEKITNEYENVLRHIQRFNIKSEFSTAIAIAIRDGAFFSYVYDFGEEGMFLHMLPLEYCRIQGKTEAGTWVIAFDLTYFSIGQNIIFVEGINGDTSGCWDEPWQKAWRDYQNASDKQAARWFIVPPEKTITLICGMQDDEFQTPLPFMTGIFTNLLEVLDYQDLIADRQELNNWALLLLKVPLLDSSNGVVDDFAVSLEIANAYKDAIEQIAPPLVGVGVLPGMIDSEITWDKDTTADSADIVSQSIKNLYKTVGVSEVVVSSGDANSAAGIKNSIANDAAFSFLLVERLEANFQYYIDKNISDNYIFSVLRQTQYNEESFIEATRQAATLGSSAMVFLESQGYTPYEAYCQILFENAIGIKDIMIPLLSSYNTAWGDTTATRRSTGNDKSTPGRNRVSDDEISGSAERTRNITDENV